MDTCKTHRFPKSGGNKAMRSRGTVEVEQCNDCLTVRVTQKLCVPTGDGGWMDITRRTFVSEPDPTGCPEDEVHAFDRTGKEIT